ncbi:PepSY domain-containing protein [Enterococcus pallens]|uniref:PepSY domain-containing protein n=1 Tax=Enterococcus pallens ATCC BAA-351 TaxID=1158607 RepID=R2QMP1_9ENTE|nr:PepSY domain-containing protein [Enterococcus pallens]EOH97842.1 hypothetical protein UAU_00510 [Enterococcus pallens ATCC BAA-351]EOU20739.1 hypothetical protein I588_01586 [Enterococcus pallens ATCC BAA-351]
MKKIALTIVLLSTLTLAGCSHQGSNPPPAEPEPASSSMSSDTNQSKVGIVQLKVSTEDAIQRYRETYPDTDITSISLEYKLGRPIYQIEGVDDTKEYELTINADTNDILQQQDENLDHDDQNKRQEEALQLDGILNADKVAEIAHSNARGSVVEMELTKDLGTTYWEVKLEDGKLETELKIDAQTGNILEKEQDD